MQWSVFASRRVLRDEGVVTVGEGGAVARHGVEVDASLQDVGRALADAGVGAEGVGQEHVVPTPPLLHLPVPRLLQLLEQRLGVHQCGGARHWNSTGNNTGQNTSVEREREMFYLTTHSTHFIYGYMASDIWLRTILIVRKETCCRHIGYSYRLTARVLLYAPSHKQDSTYHSLCYTNRGALAGTRNSSMGPPHEGSIQRPIAP